MRIPRVWVVAILATHGATFQEDDETNAWPVYRTERFDGVNPRKFLAISTFRILCIVFYCGYLFSHNVLFFVPQEVRFRAVAMFKGDLHCSFSLSETLLQLAVPCVVSTILHENKAVST